MNSYVDDFKEALKNVLMQFNSQKAAILVSGGSILPLFEDLKLDSSQWSIYMSDEHILTQNNLKEAQKYIKGCASLETIDKSTVYPDIIDIGILSIGEDGHIASLFPDHSALKSTDKFVIIYDSPKEPKLRASIGVEYLNCIKQLAFMVPKKDGKVKDVEDVHESIKKKLKEGYRLFLDSSLKR